MSDVTRINRHPELGVSDLDAINAILDEGFVCHAAYVIDGRPVIIPTLYGRDGNRLLVHGSNSMGLAKAVRRGSPLSVSVTHVDGLVVARSTFHSSANYRSAVIHGTGLLLTGDEKAKALDVIIEKVLPGRLADVRPSTESEIMQTAVIELSLDQVSAKVSSGDPEDDPEDLESKAWAGVIPISLVSGTPIPAQNLASGIEAPDYIVNYER